MQRKKDFHGLKGMSRDVCCIVPDSVFNMTRKHIVLAYLDLELLEDRPCLLPARMWVHGAHVANCTYTHG